MAFEIQDLLIDVLPAAAGGPGQGVCHQDTDQRSEECNPPSCGGQCKPHSNCKHASRQHAHRRETRAANLLLLRQQLRESLAHHP